MNDDTSQPAGKLSSFRSVPRTGVIFATTEATRLGFSTTDLDWCNLGQGMPETGPLPGAPERVHTLPIHVDDQEYAPVAGIWELREEVAGLYNRLYRRGMPSRYAAENVSICGGGRPKDVPDAPLLFPEDDHRRVGGSVEAQMGHPHPKHRSAAAPVTPGPRSGA